MRRSVRLARGWLLISEAADWVGVDIRLLHEEIAEHRLSTIRHDGSTYVERTEVERWKRSYKPRRGD